jgi:hypothetical protein
MKEFDKNCRYAAECSNKSCSFRHPGQAGYKLTVVKSINVPCKFNTECNNPKCFYSHSTIDKLSPANHKARNLQYSSMK